MDVDLRAAARDCAVAMAKGYKNLDPEIELPLRQFLVSKLQNFKRAGKKMVLVFWLVFMEEGFIW